MKTLKRIRDFIFHYVHREWFPYLVATMAGLDLFIFAVPTDIFLVAAVLARPRRWIFIGVVVAIGSVAGASLLTLLLEYDQDLIRRAFPAIFNSKHWAQIENLIQSYGVYGAIFAALGPIPMQPFVVVCALSKSLATPLFLLGLLVGRLIKFTLFAWLASHAPKLLVKLKLVSPSEVQSIESSGEVHMPIEKPLKEMPERTL